jgi:uncharacterized lipoprotein YddW (UPF0748 family)
MKKQIITIVALAVWGSCLLLNNALAAEKGKNPSQKEEIIGVWLRPTASIESARQEIANIKKAGYNAIYLETFYHGFTIYPSKYVPIRPEMKGTDYLKFYVTEAHKQGIQVHAWIETFYWEVDTTKYPKFPKTTLFDKHPEWKTLLSDGRTTQYVEDAHIFASPANPGVRKFLADYIRELITQYPVDGINLDYVRYPSGPPDAGYDLYTRNAYRKLTNIDPINISKDPANPQWQKWVEYREEQVLATVNTIGQTIKKTRPSVVFSAAIFPGPMEDRYTNYHYQNWREMIKRGYLDVIIPMAYNESISGIESQVNNVIAALPAGSKIKIMPVLAIQRKNIDWYSGSGHPLMKDQRKLMEKLNIPGFSVFCYDWMMDSAEGLDLFKN